MDAGDRLPRLLSRPEVLVALTEEGNGYAGRFDVGVALA